MYSYRVHYKDRSGEERTTMHSDGHQLSIVLRGVCFEGTSFDLLDPEEADAEALKSFTFDLVALDGCRFEVEIPLLLVQEGKVFEAVSYAAIGLHDPEVDNAPDYADVNLRLTWKGGTIKSRGRSGWFEDELIDIQRGLPSGVYMKNCFGCALSDYSPAGHQVFGDLACYRDNKEGYQRAETKDDFFRLHPLEFVQETHRCPEFEIRQPGTGYRG